MKSRLAILLATAGLSLGACAAQGGTMGVASAGSQTPYFDTASCWNYGWYGSYDLPYCGWYDGYFYPGSGIYVYDRDHHPHLWSDNQQHYWTQRHDDWHDRSTVGARSALGVADGNSVSRPVMPREMGMGMPGFSGRFAMPRGPVGGVAERSR